MKTGTEESGDDAFLPGFYPSVEPPKEAGLLSDQALRDEAGTLAALSNAKQQLAINHQFRAFDFKQDTCQCCGARMCVCSGLDDRRKSVGRTIERSKGRTKMWHVAPPRCASLEGSSGQDAQGPVQLRRPSRRFAFCIGGQRHAGPNWREHARIDALIASMRDIRLRTAPILTFSGWRDEQANPHPAVKAWQACAIDALHGPAEIP